MVLILIFKKGPSNQWSANVYQVLPEVSNLLSDDILTGSAQWFQPNNMGDGVWRASALITAQPEFIK